MIRFLTILLLLVFSIRAYGDGIVMQRDVLKPTGLPQQIGVLSHDGGRETLTIWNTVRAESQQLAWVLPLPSAPDAIQETAPEAIKLIQLVGAPPVNRGHIASILLLLIFSGPGFLLLSSRRLTNGCAMNLAVGIYLVLAVVILGVKTGSATGAASGPTVSGMRILSSQEAGNYETTVIRGDSAEAVNGWLRQEGFAPFDGKSLTVVEDYVQRQWVFLCAKLKVSSTGVAATHPLTVRFPSKDVIYPMRLTQAAGTVPVDLYCVGVDWMEDPTSRMKVIMASDSKSFRGYGYQFSIALLFARLGVETREKDPNAYSNETPLDAPVIQAGRDLLLDGMHYGSNITHLSATFTPESDWSDLSLRKIDSEKEKAPKYPSYWTLGGLLSQSLDSVWWWGALGLLGIGLAARHWAIPGRRPHWKWSLAALGMLVALVGIGVLMLKGDSVIVDASQVVNPDRATNEDSFDGLKDAWMKAIKAKP